MKKLIAALALSLSLFSFAEDGTYIIPAGSTYIVAPAVVSGKDMYALPSSTNATSVSALWAPDTAYAMGATVRLWTNNVGLLYTARSAGTSGSSLPTPGGLSVTDGTVTWLRNSTVPRTGLIVQRTGGGIATIRFGTGSLVFTADGSAVALSAPSCYNGAVFVAAAGTTTVHVVTW